MKQLKVIIGVALLFTLPAMGFVQKSVWDNWAKISDITLVTEKLADENYQLSDYDGKELRAGLLTFSFGISQYNPRPSDFVAPKDSSFSASFVNPYHIDDMVFENDDLIKIFLDESENMDENHQVFLKGLAQYRGGKYHFTFKVPSFDVNIEKDTLLLAEPSFRHIGQTSCNIGQDSLLHLDFAFDTGYPYNPDTLKQESIRLKLYKVKSDKTLELLHEKSENFTLLDKEKPLISGYYSYQYKPGIKDLGEYLLKMESSWNNVKRDFQFCINDTVRAEVKLDKEIYQQGVDKKAILNVKMDYGYPYVMAVNNDTKPTVRFIYDVKKAAAKDSLYQDSLLIADEAFENSHVFIERNIDLPLETILAENPLGNEQDTLYVDLNIVFNGMSKYDKKLPLVIKRTASGIEIRTADGTDKVEYFNLSGQRIPAPTQGKAAYIELRNGKAIKKF